ncbi:hypothetical protein MHM93_14630 [Pseudoalteromonas sp. MM17-2]|uniref:hypothetical protein n=1 Tax=Pseudoalteromonas sp. MM17-2 TaxID=2917753 RepID=UPI001EF523A3|nr:hypothetical protein [Pseudoalteromonas sp. MM17-2]MCG7545414.1 hypothetical protein [Pseudoalteromonas sp. MM17-2]
MTKQKEQQIVDKFEKDSWYWLESESGGYIPVYFNEESQFRIERGVFLSIDDFNSTFKNLKITKAVMPT